MARVLVIEDRDRMAELLVRRLQESPRVEACRPAPQDEDGFGGLLSGSYAASLKDGRAETVVYSPPLLRSMRPDLTHARGVLQHCSREGVRHLVLLSSAAVYDPAPSHPGHVSESRLLSRREKATPANHWADLESLAAIYFGGHTYTKLAILRPAAMPVAGGADYFSRLFSGRAAFVFPGHDPSLQVLSPEDLAGAVVRVVEEGADGVYNVAPDGVVPLRAALRLAGATRLPVARTLQRAARAALAPLGLARPIDQLEYIRYSWTVSNRKLKRELAWSPGRSSVEALREFAAAKSGRAEGEVAPATESRGTAAREFDDFGMDEGYIDAFGRTLFKFLHERYWRVEAKGLNNLPREGRAVLVGVHRGFMPWDAVMALHLVASRLDRYPRFLIHPGLLKFPFLFNFHTKLGGLIACQENADYVLAREEMLAIYPEGIRGAFSLYRDAYRLGKFGRDEYVKMALRNRAPLVPFVTVGSAETFPIIGKLNWGWWKRNTDWPFFPLTPTWPLLPVPLPSKWHTQFLAPVHVEHRYPPEAADDPTTVRAISQEIRGRMEEAMTELRRRRKSIFYGSVFGQEAESREYDGLRRRGRAAVPERQR
jgi:1-acyl-sn-glycerol-3-phosphate acyltransferase/nucleoside-diphosphate-sugar epimerase